MSNPGTQAGNDSGDSWGLMDWESANGYVWSECRQMIQSSDDGVGRVGGDEAVISAENLCSKSAM
jgi:hypothetical protein